MYSADWSVSPLIDHLLAVLGDCPSPEKDDGEIRTSTLGTIFRYYSFLVLTVVKSTLYPVECAPVMCLPLCLI